MDAKKLEDKINDLVKKYVELNNDTMKKRTEYYAALEKSSDVFREASVLKESFYKSVISAQNTKLESLESALKTIKLDTVDSSTILPTREDNIIEEELVKTTKPIENVE